MASQEEEKISSLFHLPQISKEMEEISLEARTATSSTSSPCVYLHSSILKSSGKNKSGWLQTPVKHQKYSENHQFYEMCQQHGLSEGKKDKFTSPRGFIFVRMPTEEQQYCCLQFFDELIEKYPKSEALQRLSLFFLDGYRFECRLDSFLRPRLRRCIPSTISTLLFLWTFHRLDFITTLLCRYKEALASSPSTFGKPVDKSKAMKWEEFLSSGKFPPELIESPVAYLSVLKVLAQHYDLLGNTTTALLLIDEAIQHSPTFPDLYVTKGKILKHAGDYTMASIFYEEARELDLADRCLNSKSVKHLLAIDKTEMAMKTATLFFHSSDFSEARKIQYLWFETAMGRSFLRSPNYGAALTYFHQIMKHFHDIRNDQMDLHLYCFAKFTYRTYITFLQMQDRLFSNKYYQTAAKKSIRIYLNLYDGKITTPSEDVEINDTTADSMKLSKTKQKKDPKKSALKKSTEKIDENGFIEETRENYLLTKTPLIEASQILQTLQSVCQFNVGFYHLQFEIAIREEKIIMMIQSLKRIWDLQKKNCLDRKFLPFFCRFAYSVSIDTLNESLHLIVFEALRRLLDGVYTLTSLSSASLHSACLFLMEKFVKMCEENFITHWQNLRAGIKIVEICGIPITPELPLFVSLILPSKASPLPLPLCQKILIYLTNYETLETLMNAFKEKAHELYPLAEAFR
ncbi:tetratricopeptide repeat-containing protein [Cardiosporidium cionae]|uniref:Tetratricopeptide repeat-containing protein n=1 Tax=Cardiosporidium cionae TaxID=476202 RepID=A0ABQ7J5B6_9APIC|nr:tetratricopeptide repeat-containing protein [Cardiosporidium cionae]|eukprot:KAF8819119.1 tetratricopeptide repeat-containing protein [Cardiosporidium cionae]